MKKIVIFLFLTAGCATTQNSTEVREIGYPWGCNIASEKAPCWIVGHEVMTDDERIAFIVGEIKICGKGKVKRIIPNTMRERSLVVCK